ncbi:MAG: Xaa-Pro peptidase family protein [Methanomicrobiales archaeon]|nr:Xaa-Pro peptidase family protein [Methanomicrobiales archaeon]
MNPLDEAMQRRSAAAYVAYGSSADADIRYLTHFQVTDPLVYVKKKGEQGIIIVSTMEYERAKRESMVQVMSRNEAGFFEFLKEDPAHREKATARMIAALAGGDVLVPPQFPFLLGKELETFFPVSVEKEAVKGMRAVKSAEELNHLRLVQRATDEAMKTALTLIKKSIPRGEMLVYRDKPLTSEDVKAALQKHLIDHGCIGRDTIVSCGPDTALPHLTGKGPLHPDEPIIIDIFPQAEDSGYFADMTRTVVKGEPSKEITEMYLAVQEAQSRAVSRIRAGISGADIHQDVVDFFKERGYESDSQGFMHNLGHGVGLEVHEIPVLGAGGESLQAGNVVTVEPGLYYPEHGGVRLEDMGAVTDGGFERFTRCEEILIL